MPSARVEYPKRVPAGSKVTFKFYITLEDTATVEYGALIAGKGTSREGTLEPGEWVKTITLHAPEYPGTYDVRAFVKVNGEKILDLKDKIEVYATTPTPSPEVKIVSAPTTVKPGDYVTIVVSTRNISGKYNVTVSMLDGKGKVIASTVKEYSEPVYYDQISLGRVPLDASPGTGKITAKLTVNGVEVARDEKPVTITGTPGGIQKVTYLGIEVPRNTVTVGETVNLVVRVNNPNYVPVKVYLNILANGKQIGTKTVDVQPGVRGIPVQLTFNEPGEFRITVELYQMLEKWTYIGEKSVFITVREALITPSKTGIKTAIGILIPLGILALASRRG